MYSPLVVKHHQPYCEILEINLWMVPVVPLRVAAESEVRRVEGRSARQATCSCRTPSFISFLLVLELQRGIQINSNTLEGREDAAGFLPGLMSAYESIASRHSLAHALR